MCLLALFQKAGPEFRLQFLLAQNQLNATRSMVHLAILGIDLAVELKGNMILNSLDRRATKRYIGRGEFEDGR